MAVFYWNFYTHPTQNIQVFQITYMNVFGHLSPLMESYVFNGTARTQRPSNRLFISVTLSECARANIDCDAD